MARDPQGARAGLCLHRPGTRAGLVAVAVPLQNLRGETVAAINICGHTMQTSVDKLTSQCLPEALKTARQITARLP